MKVYEDNNYFFRHSLNSIVTQYLSSAISVLISITNARVLGPEGKGKFSLIVLIPWFAVVLGRLGIGHAVIYCVKKTSKTNLIINSFIIVCFLSIFLVVITLPLVFRVKNLFFENIEVKFLIIASFLIPLLLLENYVMAIFQALYRIVLRNMISIILLLSNLLLLLILTAVLRLGLTGAIISFIVSVILSLLISILFLLKEMNFKEAKVNLTLIKDLLEYGLKTHIGNVLKDMSYRGDILIISYFLNPISVGYYMVAVNIAEMLWKIPEGVGSVLLPCAVKMEKTQVKLFTPLVCRGVIFLVFIFCLMVFFFRNSIIKFFFGEAYLPSANALLLLLPGVFAFAIWKILANDLIAQGLPFYYSFTSFISLVTMIIADFLLIPKLGIKGASLASSIAYIIATALIIVFYLRATNNNLSKILLPLRTDFEKLLETLKQNF